MMDFISIPVIVGTVVFGIYKLFELFARRKERLALIEKLGQLPPPINKISLPDYSVPGLSFGALKIGCLLMGFGLGLLIGYIICASTINDYIQNSRSWEIREVSGLIYGASIFAMGGIGLITAFVIEMRLSKKKD